MEDGRIASDAPEEPLFESRSLLTEDLYGRFARAHLKLTGGGRAMILLCALLFAAGTFLLVLDLRYSEGGREVRARR